MVQLINVKPNVPIHDCPKRVANAGHDDQQNVAQASEGTRSVTERIVEVSIAASQSEQTSAEISSAASELSMQSGQLKQSVEQFLHGMRA